MDISSFGRVVGRVAMAAGFALALSACSMAVEDPPRAMYGTAAWSDAWDQTCNDVDPSDTQPQPVGYEHLNTDCQQYLVAQRMRYHLPLLAESDSP
jgi:hypothetical protein